MPLTEEDLPDLIIGTLKNFGDRKPTQIAAQYQQYTFSEVLKKDKMKIGHGTAINEKVVVSTGGAARRTGLGQKDNVNIGAVLQEINVPFRRYDTHAAHEIREMLENRDESQLADIIKVRDDMAMLDLWELLEEDYWSTPADSNDKEKMWGVPFWIQKAKTGYATDEPFGFLGGNPGGFSGGAGGLDVATYPNWRNGCFKYTDISHSDFSEAMCDTFRHINFKSPVSEKGYMSSTGRRYRIFTNARVLRRLETLMKGSNDNLGADFAKYMNQVVFKGLMIQWVPLLDSDTDDPVYMVDTDVMYPVVLRGDDFRRSKPRPAADQHNVMVQFIDLSVNTVCRNRRQCAVGVQVAA